jgi:hypothetical protein
VNAGVDVVLARDARDQFAIANIALIERHVGRDGSPVPSRQIIQNNDKLAAFA